MSEHTARVVELAYEEHGPKSARAIVLLHGSPLDRRMWKPQLEDFVGAGYRVVLPDLRGHGRSPTPAAPWSLANCAADLFALADRLEIERFVLGGLSVGGMVAVAAAKAAPQRVEGLLLAATRADADAPSEVASRRRAADELRERGSIGAESFVPRVFTADTISQRPALVSEFLAIANAQPLEGRTAMLDAIARRENVLPWLETAKVPALAIVGEEDPITPPSMSREIHRRLAGSFLQVIEEASHLVNMEAPGVFNRAALNWLEFSQLEP